MNIKTTKSNLITITGITPKEFTLIHAVLTAVDNCMEWNKERQCYTNGSYTLTVDEMKTLKKIRKDI